MKTLRIIALAALVISTITINVALATDHPTKSEHPKKTEHPATSEHPTVSNGVCAVATSNGSFKTFLAAVEAAGLMDKFQGEGPFTVFAPTDAAFAKLPKGTMEDLLKPANKAKLAGLLANHVVPGKILVKDMKTMKATNVSGHDLGIKVKGSTVMVNEGTIVQADLAADNGVLHGIDCVLMPAASSEHPASDTPKDHPDH